MANVRVKKKRMARISQGDIFRDIECIERIVERRGVLDIAKIEYPLVVVLTQDCDLLSDSRESQNQDKKLFSVLVAPLYNAEHVYQGQHLTDLGLTMTTINKAKTQGQNLRNNETPRYHYLDFPPDIPIVPSIVDFKHFFSVSIESLNRLRRAKFVCRLSELFREDLSLRFAGYLARIGLPEISSSSPTTNASQSSVAPTAQGNQQTTS